MKRIFLVVLVLALIFSTIVVSYSQTSKVAVNVGLKQKITKDLLSDLSKYGKVSREINELNAISMLVEQSSIEKIESLEYVESVNEDIEIKAAPIDTVPVTDYSDGLCTWNLDVVNVADWGFANRTVQYDGSGVYIAVLDTGLVDSWRQYFPEERIAANYAKAFIGGGNERSNGYVTEVPNLWQHDQNSHGTHVTSTILGYNFLGAPINGIAPKATVIPVKVLNQSGRGWSSVIAQGIMYIAKLKEGPLSNAPIVINMSLGAARSDILIERAIDYAIAKGVVVVAAAGNSGEEGMGYPGAYQPVISAGAAGWIHEWQVGNMPWWYGLNVNDPSNADEYYVTDFSSREKIGQDLDVIAPGSWVVGPYKTNSNSKYSYYYLGGTSMASPHVAGIAALMLEKNPGLKSEEIENIMENTALDIGAGSKTINDPQVGQRIVSWGTDAIGAGLIMADEALNAVE